MGETKKTSGNGTEIKTYMSPTPSSMDKMELFFDKDRYSDNLTKCAGKGIPRNILRQFSSVDGRLGLLDALASYEMEIEPPLVVEIPKSSGGVREIFVNTYEDRVILSNIYGIYYDLYGDRVHPNCVAYKKGTSVAKVLNRVLNRLEALRGQTETEMDTGETDEEAVHILGYKLDISKYFDSVNEKYLNKILRSFEENPDELDPIEALVRDYYSTHVVRVREKDPETGKSDIKEVPRYKSLAQGCALSALLANIALRDLDEAVSKMDVLYFRYSDDILVLGKDSDKALTLIQQMLSDAGLHINEKKLFPINADSKFTFLGFEIDGTTIRLSKELRHRFLNRIKGFTKASKKSFKNEAALRKSISNIKYMLYCYEDMEQKRMGYANTLFACVNDENCIRELDNQIKEHLRAQYTGRWNFTHNRNKVPEEMLRGCGWVSLMHMYKCFKADRDLYKSEVQSLCIANFVQEADGGKDGGKDDGN